MINDIPNFYKKKSEVKAFQLKFISISFIYLFLFLNSKNNIKIYKQRGNGSVGGSILEFL